MKLLILLFVLVAVRASAEPLSDARSAVALIVPETESLLGECTYIAPNVDIIRSQIAILQAALSGDDIAADLAGADDALDTAMIDCNSWVEYQHNYGKILLDMYLVHLDDDLLKAESGNKFSLK